jgi:outer membrane receptor protein involved in Fe transport
MERAMGIEPTAQAWEAWVLPLYDARVLSILVVFARRCKVAVRSAWRPLPRVSRRVPRYAGNFAPGNAPRWTGNAMARYTLALFTGHLALQVDGNHRSRFYFNLSDILAVEQKGFGLGNVRVSYSPQGDKIEVGASVENVANKHYGVMGFDITSINGMAQLYPGMPRWWKLHVNYKF